MANKRVHNFTNLFRLMSDSKIYNVEQGKDGYSAFTHVYDPKRNVKVPKTFFYFTSLPGYNDVQKHWDFTLVCGNLQHTFEKLGTFEKTVKCLDRVNRELSGEIISGQWMLERSDMEPAEATFVGTVLATDKSGYHVYGVTDIASALLPVIQQDIEAHPENAKIFEDHTNGPIYPDHGVDVRDADNNCAYPSGLFMTENFNNLYVEATTAVND